ncbi:MAG: hypothetical protein ABSH00_15010 [Bryobacteraceae bacterium]
MRALFRVTLAFSVLAWCAMAQRGGGHGGGGGGFHGGGGGGFHSSIGGGFHGGGAIGGSGYRGGYGYGYGRGGYGYGRGYGYGGWGYGGYLPYYGWGYPWYGFGLGYWPDYGYYNYYPYGYSYPDTYSDPGYAYSPGPAMTYAPADPPAQAVAPSSYGGAAHPVTRSYDEYGQETAAAGGSATSSSPIYLIAQKDGEIQAAASYWIAGQTLHYVTLDRQEKQVELSSIDRALTQQLNHERHVSITLPPQ